MRLLVDTAGVTFTVTKEAEEKTDQNGKQRFNKDGAPMWTVQVMALDPTGGDILKVTVAGEKPKVTVGQVVTPVELEALPWATNGRNGVAFRATQFRNQTAAKAA